MSSWTSSGSVGVCSSCHPSGTRASPSTTRPLTSASCHRVPSRSVWSRSRRPRAARPSWPPTSVGFDRLSTTGTRAFSWRVATRATTRRPSTWCSRTVSWPRGSEPVPWRARACTCGASPPRACDACTAISPYARRWSAHRTAATAPRRSVTLDEAHELIAKHLEGPVAAAEYTQHVEHDPELRRWYVRFGCEGRDATTIYFDLHERTLRYERYLLRRNHTMYGARFSIGPDGDIYLVGRVALEHLSVTELDRIIGELYELVETWF